MDSPSIVTIASSFSTMLLILCIVGLVVLMVPNSQAHTASRTGGSAQGLRSILNSYSSAVVSAYRRTSTKSGIALVVVVALLGIGLFAWRTFAGPGDVLLTVDGLDVTVGAEKGWQKTGIQVNAGEKIVFWAKGEWTHQFPEHPKYGPGGSEKMDAGAIVPTAQVGALIGRVGNSPPFVIGDGATVTARASGQLQLAMNDTPGGTNNNQGRLSVHVAKSEP